VPDHRKHRGPHPEDAALFALAQVPRLQTATQEFCWLLGRGYAGTSTLKLVGDRHALTARQRVAIARVVAADAEVASRRSRMVSEAAVAGRALWLDGYNVLTTVEAALAGGVVLAACDGAYRDIASMHGSFRKVAETLPALELIGCTLAALGPSRTVWLLDAPVSNSGRLKRLMEELAAARGWPWEVRLVPDPDRILAASRELIATADSVVLDRCGPWLNLARLTVFRHVPTAWVVDLTPPD
jgi:hypothetical protein